MIEVHHLTKRYGPFTAVDDVTFTVEKGEILGFLGPNGAGKTTTFYMTTGLVKPNKGRVMLDETEITDWPMFRRAKAGIGYLPQDGLSLRGRTVFAECMTVFADLRALEEEQEELARRMGELDHTGDAYRQVAERFQMFEQSIRDRPEVLECDVLTGPSDFLLRVVKPKLDSIQGVQTAELLGAL